MWRFSVLEKTLRDQKWQIAGFGVALALMAALDMSIWPAYKDQLQNFEIPAAFQAFLGDMSIATGPGFLSAEFFSWIPILLIVYAVIAGTGAIAGEESAGSMDLLLAQPVSRQALVLQKTAAVCVGSVLIVAIGYVGFAVSMPFVTIDVTLGDVAIGCANMLPVTLLFFALSLWLGAVAPSRAIAAGTAIAIVTASYFVYTVANGVDVLRNLQYASPFYYYGTGKSLVEGFNWPHVGLLLGLAVVFVAAALRTFERRDVVAGGATEVGMAGMLRRALG